MQAKVSDFILNTKSALDYYNKSGVIGDVFDSLYLVGDNDLTSMKEFSLGSNSQKNDAHFIEIYAAFLLLLISLTSQNLTKLVLG